MDVLHTLNVKIRIIEEHFDCVAINCANTDKRSAIKKATIDIECDEKDDRVVRSVVQREEIRNRDQ